MTGTASAQASPAALRILHVSGDWKWTGPAEPMLRLLLAQRAAGHVAELICPDAPGGRDHGLAGRARSAGVEPLYSLSPGRGARPWRGRADVRRVRDVLAAGCFDVLHTWHTRDHLLAWRARAGLASSDRAVIVRSCARAEVIAGWPWNRWLFGAASDALVFPSAESARANARLCSGPVDGVAGAVDLERFQPRPPDPAVRLGLGLAPQQRVLGVVARVQRHRRFDLLLEAMSRLAQLDPEARLLIIGRGTHLDSVAREPAERLGLSDRVVFAGHRKADYADVLRTLDVFTFLVPGSDGTCRALLEAHACGLPSVATRRGAIPEIVAHGETGLLVNEDPEALCAAWRNLLDHPGRRARMGAAARRRAERHFDPARLAADVERLYLATRR